MRHRRLHRPAQRGPDHPGRAAAAGISRLRFGRHRRDPGRQHRDPPRRRQAEQPGDQAGASRPSTATSASATRAGPPTASRASATRIPTPTAPARSSSCRTASSRTSASCAPSWRPKGIEFQSETDTEVIAHLIELHYTGDATLAEAVRQALRAAARAQRDRRRCRSREPGTLVAARLGNAGGVAVGYGEGEMFIASDMPAILEHTRRMVFLENRQMAVVTRDGADFCTLDGQPLEPAGPHHPLGSRSRRPRASTSTSCRRRSTSRPTR